MPKIPTQWTTNTNIGVVDTYDSASSYNGGGTASAFDSYDGAPAGQSPITTKTPTPWSGSSKTATQWIINSNAQTNLRPYDSGSVVYDSSSLIYDGNTNSPIATKPATVWSTT